MPYYRVDFRHTTEGVQNLVSMPIVRREAATKAIESVGGRLLDLWYSFGKEDGFATVEAPDNEAVVAAVLKINAAAGVEAWTTPLITPEEFYEALKRASKVKYQAPKAKRRQAPKR